MFYVRANKRYKIKGANFVNQAELNLFNSSNDKVAKVALVYGKWIW